MRINNIFLAGLLLALLCPSVARAQEMHPHSHDRPEKLGQVNFNVSCSAASQKQFNRATALLHSFWYGEAEKAFSTITMNEPTCAMAYWGVAMSLYHPVWAPSTASELE